MCDVEIEQKNVDFVTRLVNQDIELSIISDAKTSFSSEEVMKIYGLATKVSARKYSKDYDDNEIAADNQYKGKKFIIFGKINSISKDFTGSPYLVLSTGKDFDMGVHAAIDRGEMEHAATLKKGQEIHLVCEASTKIGPVATARKCVEFSRFIEPSIKEVVNGFFTGKVNLKEEFKKIEKISIFGYAMASFIDIEKCYDLHSVECRKQYREIFSNKEKEISEKFAEKLKQLSAQFGVELEMPNPNTKNDNKKLNSKKK
jgi:hypothetical protein